MTWHQLITNFWFHSVITGIASGITVDIAAFLAFKSPDEAKKYNYSLTAWRAFHGFYSSLIVASGLWALGGGS